VHDNNVDIIRIIIKIFNPKVPNSNDLHCYLKYVQNIRDPVCNNNGMKGLSS